MFPTGWIVFSPSSELSFTKSSPIFTHPLILTNTIAMLSKMVPNSTHLFTTVCFFLSDFVVSLRKNIQLTIPAIPSIAADKAPITFAPALICCAAFSGEISLSSSTPALVSSPVPPSTTPSELNTEPIVPKKHLISKSKLSFSTYSPSNFAFTGISSSSLPLICAQPVSPGFTSFA